MRCTLLTIWSVVLSFNKSGCAVRMVKCLIEDWLLVLQQQLEKIFNAVK